MSMGKQVPPKLIYEIEQGKKKEIEEDVYNNFNNNPLNNNTVAPVYQQQQQNHVTHVPYIQHMPYQNNHVSRMPHPPPPPHKYSPQYAAYVGARPRAQASARIGLGGAF